MLGDSLGYTDGKVIGSDGGIKLGSIGGKLLGIILGNVYGSTLGIGVGTELCSLDRSFDDYNCGKFERLLFKDSPGYNDNKVCGCDEGI